MSATTAATPGLGRRTLTWAAVFSRSQSGLVVLALAAVAVHVLDDNYLQPQPGTSAGDHLSLGAQSCS